MAISDFFFGQPERTEQLPAISGPQEQYLNQILQMLQGMGPDIQNYFSDLFSESPEAFEKFAAPARREFEEQIVPSIAEQFAGSGALSSSGFAQALGGAGAGLTERLAQMRESLRGQGLSQLQGFGQSALGTQPFGYQTTAAQPGFLQNLMGPLLGATGTTLGGYLGRPRTITPTTPTKS